MRNKLILAILISGIVHGAFAQKIAIKGTVKDATNKAAAEYVNVVLQTSDSTFVTGTTTNGKGDFLLNKIHAGDYMLVLSSVGCRTQFITLDGIKQNVNLGDIFLEDDAVAMEGVTVSASGQISRSDRKLVFPSERQMKVSTNGVNLLQQMMLPRIQINPMNNEIGLLGGGELQLRINGAKAEIEEIKALQPSDIIRIEYHDNPGLRYGNAEVVLDYIVRRPDTGGNFGVDLSQGMNAMWGEYNVFGKVNHKKSEFGVSYYMGPRDFYGMYRDNEEEFHLADGTTLHRIEEGEPGHGAMFMNNLSVNYNLQQTENSLFSATFRLRSNSQPHWDYQGVLTNVSDPDDKVNMIDRTKNSWTRPSLDLYYQQGLKNKQLLIFNVVGTYNREKSRRLYQESLQDELLTDINNNVLGDKYSLIGEAIYEKQFSKGNALSFGLRHTQSFANNEYRNGHHYETDMNQGDTYAYGEYRGKLNKLDYRLGVGVTRSYYKQSGDDSYENYSFNPRLVLHYALPGNSFIRWKSDISNASPSLGNLSAVEQIVDSLQIRRGNPNLKAYLRYHTELTYEWQKGIFYSNLWGAYDYQPDAIMEEKYQEGDKIVQTWDNQKDWQKLSGRVTLRVGPIKDMLQFSFTGGVNHYMSHGNTYSHTYTNWYCNAEASFNYKQFSLYWQMNTNWNNFWGETLSGGENIQVLVMYYTHKNLRVGLGAFNPFTDNYKQQTENWNKYASYKKTNYVKESSQMFLASVSYNFSFGRKFKAGKRRVNNSDNDSGVMSSGK